VESNEACREFVDNHGVECVKEALSRGGGGDRVTVGCLVALSQVARVSGKWYGKLRETNVVEEVIGLLRHDNVSVRSKACNLVGNMCRHDGSFYNDLGRGGGKGGDGGTIIDALIERCVDVDDKTRKFACFAVGNAAFHSSELYDELRSSVPYLVQGLKDKDDKTRANAAGALGNLVRNSSELCEELVFHGVGRELLELAAREKFSNPRRICLFSLGTLSVYSKCREELVRNNILEVVGKMMEGEGDEVAKKYLERVTTKLRGSCIR
jgi:fused-like protein